MKILERLFGSGRKDQKKADVGRNDLCWCGSGRKYKRCCLDRDERERKKKNGML